MTMSLAVRNAATIALLLAGALVFGVGWFVGLALLWTSPTWCTRDKVLATVLVPGGLPMAVLIAGFGVPATDAGRVPGLVTGLQIVLRVAPIAAATLLVRRAFGLTRWSRSGVWR